MTRPIQKRYLKTWAINGYFQYQIFEVDSGFEKWLEATPITHGVTRVAENETALRIILVNDAKNMERFMTKVY